MASRVPSSPVAPRRPPRGPPLSEPPPSNGPPLPPSSGLNETEERLRMLIAEQSRRSPLDELVRRSIVDGGRQTPGKGSSGGVPDGLEQLLRETGDLPWDERVSVENLNEFVDANEDGGRDGFLAAPVSPSRVRPATMLPSRALPPIPPPDRTPPSPRPTHLQPPPALLPPSANTSDDEAPLPSSPDPQESGIVSPVAAADDVNDLYSRPTERRTRLSTLGPKIRRDGPAPWELEEEEEGTDASGTGPDARTLRSNRSSPDLKDDHDGAAAAADDASKSSKRAWIGSLGRKKKDRDEDGGAAWKALGYAPPSPSASVSVRRPSESTFPSSPNSARFLAEPLSPGGGSPHVDRSLKTRRSASGGLRKIFAKSPNPQAADGSIQEISAPLPAPPPPNAVPIPQALMYVFEDSLQARPSASSTSLSSSPPAPPSPIARRRPPRLTQKSSATSLHAGAAGQLADPGFNLELRPVSMAFSAKFSDHLQSPTSPAYAESLSPRSIHGFGGALTSPRAESFASVGSATDDHGGGSLTPSLRSIGLGPRRPSETVSGSIAEEAEDDDGDKDELIRSLRHELKAERELRRRVVEDYENRLRDLKQVLISNGLSPVHLQLPPTPRTPDVFVSPSGSPSDL